MVIISISFSIFVFLVNVVHGANILCLFYCTSPSHHIWNSALANGLAAHGHNVTVLSIDKEENPPERVHYIYVEGIYDEAYVNLMQGMYNFRKHVNPLREPINFNNHWYEVCEKMIETNGFRTLLDYPDDFRFDLIVYDFTVGSCFLGFMHKFKYPPLISVTAYDLPSYITPVIGGHQYYSYIPHNYLVYDEEMDFWQRLYNFAVHMVEYFHRTMMFNRQIDKLVEPKFGKGVPHMTELEQRSVLAFVNTNPAFDYLAPLPENVIPVGALQVQEPKPIPTDVKNFIESSKNGTVLFSLGTNVQSSLMDKDKQKILIEAFRSMPEYNILWKFERSADDLQLPKNVMIRKWLPQSDILAHPNIKAFFTHSGLLSTHEAIWRGVPIIGMPFGYDQNNNLMKSVKRKFAEGIDFDTMTTDIVKQKLQMVLENSIYAENAKKISARFRDQKEKPLNRAIWWVDWVLRNPDCEHLKSPVLRLGFIVGNSYDIIAFICFIIFLISFFVIKFFICPYIRRKMKTQPHSKSD